VAAGVVLAVALLPGCGEDADPLELVSTAGAETADDGVARVTSTTELSLGGASITLESRGLVDFDHHRASLTTKLPSGGGDTEVVVDGTTMYPRGAGVGGELGLLTPWVSIDLGRMGGLTGTDLAQLGSSNEPTSGLELLTGAEEVEEVGHEEVRGAATTHYRATVDLRKAVEEAGAVTDPDQFEKFAELLGDGRVDVDVWLDAEDRVRRMRYEQPMPGDEAASATVTVELADFGTDERIEVPPPTDVTDVTERILQDG
jgi:hypothetical protein